MSRADKPSSPEREHTDESLRVERERTDDALSEKLAAIEETADEVINKARERADAVLAATRRLKDRDTSTPPAPAMKREREVADKLVQEERADADEALRVERAESADVLATGREETDEDLHIERVKSDVSVAARDEFLGLVSHDLRSMLTSMTGYAGLIAKATQPGDARLTYAQRIQRSGGRMNRLIGDLVDVASIEAGALAVTLERADLVRVVTEAIDTLQAHAAANDVTLSFEGPEALEASFDPARILQVLANLLSNAIKFTPAKGSVVVSVEQVEGAPCVLVRDTGIGIAQDKLHAIFERFLQIDKNDRRGVGLGLFISKCIVQGHGGRIWAESKLDEGSTFRFTLAAP